MKPEQQITVDWVNLPEGIATLSLWSTLHDGDVLSIESDLLARTVTLRFDVAYVRHFHHLPEEARFVITVSGVQSVRSIHNVPRPGGFSLPQGISREEESALIAEYQSKCREESQSWSEFERMISDEMEVSDAILAYGSNGVALQLGVLFGNGHYAEAYVRGDAITFLAGDRELNAEQFVSLGRAYWDAFEKRD